MSKESPLDNQTEINQYTSELIHSPAWKYFREAAEREMSSLLQNILTVATPDIPAQDNEKLYTMRDVQCIKFRLLQNFIDLPIELLSMPLDKVNTSIVKDDLTRFGLIEEDQELNEDPYSN